MKSCLNCGSDVEPSWFVCLACGKNLRFNPHEDKGRNVKYDKISKYYDLEVLTQKELNSELTRLHKEIEEMEIILINLEKKDFNHPDIFNFYRERDRIRSQLDTIYGFLFKISQERFNDFLKDSKLRSIYGRLPNWRLEQLKEKESQGYYYLKFPEFVD